MAAIDDAIRSLLRRLPTGLKQTYGAGSDMEKLLGTISEHNLKLDAQVTAVTNSKSIETATGGVLDRYGAMYGLSRQGDIDTLYRLRILIEALVRTSKGTTPDIKTFLSSQVGIPREDIRIVENEDIVTAAFRPRYYYIETDLGVLANLGFETQAEIDDAIAIVSEALGRIEAAGIRGQFKIQGDFFYEGDDADFGPSGVGTADNGYWNNATLYPDFGSENEGGTWGGFG